MDSVIANSVWDQKVTLQSGLWPHRFRSGAYFDCIAASHAPERQNIREPPQLCREEPMNGRPSIRTISNLLAGFIAVAVLTTVAIGPAPAQTPRLSDIAAYEGSDREKRLVEGAKREGELMFYSSIPVEDIAILTAAFDKRYGVKVKVWRSDSEGFLQRIVNEAKARRYEVDVMAGASSALEPLHRERMLSPINSPYLADLIPESIASHR